MTGTSGERWQAEVDSRLARLELRVDEAEFADTGLVGVRGAASQDDEYLDLDSWVQGYFRATFSRPFGGEYRWCTEWREHREAQMRLDALWSSWKALRVDRCLGMSTWLHNYLDPQLIVLLGARGPFRSCTTIRHEPDASSCVDQAVPRPVDQSLPDVGERCGEVGNTA